MRHPEASSSANTTGAASDEVGYILWVAVRMLHAIGGFPHPWMAAFHPWMAGMSMDGRNLGSTILYISSLVSTSNSDNIHR